MKRTVVYGASTSEERYSNKAIKILLAHKHEVLGVGKSGGEVEGVKIQPHLAFVENIDTVTLYLNPILQKSFYDEILSLKPKRIIFNPGTENEEFEKLAKEHGIQVEEACTLVLLSTGQY